MLDLMLQPFLACLILTGILAYLGLHILERGVIFVDLALAQIAALGAAAGFVLGYEFGTFQGYLVSFAFTLLGAFVFSVTRVKKAPIPQEALIGIAYVVAASAAILVLDKAPEGAEHIKEMMVGNILFVNAGDNMKMFLLYGAVGIFHVVFRKRFFEISFHPLDAEKQGISIFFWDFLFYAVFGVVVTSAVRLAGVLLVFCFLIVPSVCAALLTRDINSRIFLGWGVGALVSAIGMFLSASLDLPTGPVLACTFGICLSLLGLGRLAVPKADRGVHF